MAAKTSFISQITVDRLYNEEKVSDCTKEQKPLERNGMESVAKWRHYGIIKVVYWFI